MRRFIVVFACLFALFLQVVFAQTITTQSAEGYDGLIAVAGGYDNYPIGYYRLVIPTVLILAIVVVLLVHIRRKQKGTSADKKAVCCDTQSMDMLPSEKEITESILKGFDNNEFKMYLQFIVDRQTRKIISAEALSRWDNLEKGLLSPGLYIRNMKTSGLISRHDFCMFEMACRKLEEWADTQYSDISISCNFTRITLSEENFVDKLKEISGNYKFDKSKLAIEITEDAIEKDRKMAMENVEHCKELGFKVYLDDLGVGYTSLANLCDYPVDVVKIDRDILLKTDTNKGRTLFWGIISLAHSLNISVICEGVETQQQNELVSESGCDYIQGWYYSKAIPAEGCETFIKQYSANLQSF